MIGAAKVLMQVGPGVMNDLAVGPETGMDFYVAESQNGWIVILENRDAMPLYPDQVYYDVTDLLNGTPIPTQRSLAPQLSLQAALASRSLASLVTLSPIISPRYVAGTAGAIPLIAQDTLLVNTVFLRYISTPTDHRFNTATGELRAGTYLTSQLDRNHADTGFGSVGRYALPLPVPVTNVIEYTLPAGTVIDVGTVAPQFGQAGGGVEICLTANTVVTQGSNTPLPPY